ncbi:uncharacterized protein LAESUDRAFT_429807 [Laetiporus sulphureus 93-53]|uniref:Uncharacterized protein n=1 Tax=Laetiporus sulphureus 93-53 TaxID=1314785 RepID=A0A165GMG6_9APHY|nr:uncharacterized protein LAESUDRAFT_429807 [Laetiporus sulphureus 93-53]KZT10554.1 hypothetical protein LAESUDRAFT_429807 [Laetiporus sulphureus 93-53]
MAHARAFGYRDDDFRPRPYSARPVARQRSPFTGRHSATYAGLPQSRAASPVINATDIATHSATDINVSPRRKGTSGLSQWIEPAAETLVLGLVDYVLPAVSFVFNALAPPEIPVASSEGHAPSDFSSNGGPVRTGDISKAARRRAQSPSMMPGEGVPIVTELSASYAAQKAVDHSLGDTRTKVKAIETSNKGPKRADTKRAAVSGKRAELVKTSAKKAHLKAEIEDMRKQVKAAKDARLFEEKQAEDLRLLQEKVEKRISSALRRLEDLEDRIDDMSVKRAQQRALEEEEKQAAIARAEAQRLAQEQEAIARAEAQKLAEAQAAFARAEEQRLQEEQRQQALRQVEAEISKLRIILAAHEAKWSRLQEDMTLLRVDPDLLPWSILPGSLRGDDDITMQNVRPFVLHPLRERDLKMSRLELLVLEKNRYEAQFFFSYIVPRVAVHHRERVVRMAGRFARILEVLEAEEVMAIQEEEEAELEDEDATE